MRLDGNVYLGKFLSIEMFETITLPKISTRISIKYIKTKLYRSNLSPRSPPTVPHIYPKTKNSTGMKTKLYRNDNKTLLEC